MEGIHKKQLNISWTGLWSEWVPIIIQTKNGIKKYVVGIKKITKIPTRRKLGVQKLFWEICFTAVSATKSYVKSKMVR